MGLKSPHGLTTVLRRGLWSRSITYLGSVEPLRQIPVGIVDIRIVQILEMNGLFATKHNKISVVESSVA